MEKAGYIIKEIKLRVTTNAKEIIGLSYQDDIRQLTREPKKRKKCLSNMLGWCTCLTEQRPLELTDIKGLNG